MLLWLLRSCQLLFLKKIKCLWPAFDSISFKIRGWQNKHRQTTTTKTGDATEQSESLKKLICKFCLWDSTWSNLVLPAGPWKQRGAHHLAAAAHCCRSALMHKKLGWIEWASGVKDQWPSAGCFNSGSCRFRRVFFFFFTLPQVHIKLLTNKLVREPGSQWRLPGNILHVPVGKSTHRDPT